MVIEFAVSGFRSFRDDVPLQVRVGGRTVLVGTNNSGKTSTLEALARAIWSMPQVVCDPGRTFHSDWFSRTNGGLARPTCQLRLPAALVGRELFADGVQALHATLTASVPPARVSTAENIQARFVCTHASLSDGTVAKPLWRAPDSALQMPDLTACNDFGVIGLLSAPEHFRPLDARTDFGLGGMAYNILEHGQTPLHRAFGELARRTIYLPAERNPSYGPSPLDQSVSHETVMAVSALLKRLSHNRPRFDELVSALKLLFPDVETLNFDERGKDLTPVVQRAGERIPIADTGFGFRNAVHLLTVLSAMPRDGLLLIDEPDSGLNQAKHRDLAVILESIRPDVSLVLATQAEGFCRGLSTASDLWLVENTDRQTRARRVDVSANASDRRALAEAMGCDPLFLLEGGKLLYVEGPSDVDIVRRWLALNDLQGSGVNIQALGGCSSLEVEFAKPLFTRFADGVFFLLDSDRASMGAPPAENISRLLRWFQTQGIPNFYVLNRRELENYLGRDAIALAASIHPASLQSAPGSDEAFDDLKALYTRETGRPYESRHISVRAFESLDTDRQRRLFGTENPVLIGLLRRFLGLATPAVPATDDAMQRSVRGAPGVA